VNGGLVLSAKKLVTVCEYKRVDRLLATGDELAMVRCQWVMATQFTWDLVYWCQVVNKQNYNTGRCSLIRSPYKQLFITFTNPCSFKTFLWWGNGI